MLVAFPRPLRDGGQPGLESKSDALPKAPLQIKTLDISLLLAVGGQTCVDS